MYADSFSLENFEFTWHSINRLFDWNPSVVLSKGRPSGDWRRRIEQSRVSNILKQITESINTIQGIPFLSSIELLDTDGGTGRYQITATHLLVCPMKEARCGALFTYTEKAMANSISQATISIYTACGNAVEGNAATEAFSNVVISSKESPQKFFSACCQALNT